MIGDIISIKPHYLETAKEIFYLIEKKNADFSKQKYVITIGGESGSGKSVASMCLQKTLLEHNIHSLVFHLDDYFYFPPKINHNRRLEDINRVGRQEVNLDRLNQNILDFKMGSGQIIKPEINYNSNEILEDILFTDNINVLIVEGTYSLMLDNVDLTIFMDRTYIETKQNRIERGRDVVDIEFVESVLEIEHKIIRATKSKAKIIVNSDYTVVENN
jgi:uridine kinase